MAVVRTIPAPLQRPIRLGVLISGGGTTLLNFVDQIQAGKLAAEIPVVIPSAASTETVNAVRCPSLFRRDMGGRLRASTLARVTGAQINPRP